MLEDIGIRNVLRMLGSEMHYCFPSEELQDVYRTMRAGWCTYRTLEESNHLFRVVAWIGEVAVIYVHLTEKGKDALAKIEAADKKDLRL